MRISSSAKSLARLEPLDRRDQATRVLGVTEEINSFLERLVVGQGNDDHGLLARPGDDDFLAIIRHSVAGR